MLSCEIGNTKFSLIFSAAPDCIRNLITDPKYAEKAKALRKELDDILTKQGDPRMVGDDHYDEIEYFKTGWKNKRPRFLDKADPVHQAMEAADWNHGNVNNP